MTALVDMVSRRVGRLTVLRRGPNFGAHAAWVCQCECGNEVNICGRDMRVGSSRSCGCLQIEVTRERATTHGHTASKSPSPEYRVWGAMHSRCKDHPNYAGRGIKVCERWFSFENFLADMGSRPMSPRHTLERKNSNGDYEPTNCLWATYAAQQRNKRTNILIEVDGETVTLRDAAMVAGLVYQTVWLRFKAGLSLVDVFSHQRVKYSACSGSA